MPASHRRWTSKELAIIAQSPSPDAARPHLPDRTALAVATRWRQYHADAILATSRPPQTPEEYQLVRLLEHVRRLCREAQVHPDVTALLHSLQGRWQEYLEGDAWSTAHVQVVALRRAPH